MSISQDWITNELEDTELEALHRSPSVEYSFYNAVRAGDMEAVNKNCEEDSFLHLKGTGILSKNPLTNLKYHFVVTTAMLTVTVLTVDWSLNRHIVSAIFTF